MAINFNAIEAQIAADIGVSIASGVNDGIATIAVPFAPLVATATWNGTGVVAMADTSELQIGYSIRLNADGNWFLVDSIIEDVSVGVTTQYGAVFPSGATPSSFTDIALPPPATSQSIEDSLGASIGFAVRNALEAFASDAEISGTTAGGDTIGPGVIA